jgi:microcystin-dependent protein
MAPFVGELRLFGGNFAPEGWMTCAGQLLPISEYEVLFTLLGTTYGGDGESTFQLPDLRGRVPLHTGGGFSPGQSGGSESVTLTQQTMAAHTHVPNATANAASQSGPNGNVPAALTGGGTTSAYGTAAPLHAIDPSSVTSAGGGQPHPNIQPYLCITFIIALYGIFPSQ